MKTLDQLSTELDKNLNDLSTNFHKTIKNISRKAFMLPVSVLVVTIIIVVGCILMMALTDMHIAPLIICVATTLCAPVVIRAIKSEQEDTDERVALMFSHYDEQYNAMLAEYNNAVNKITLYNIYCEDSYLKKWVITPLRNRYKNDDEFLNKLIKFHYTCINDASKTSTEWLDEFLK